MAANPYAHDSHGHGPHDPNDPADPHSHPTAGTYVKVGLFLTVLTAMEVWAYYVPAFVASHFFVPALLIMSAVKMSTWPSRFTSAKSTDMQVLLVSRTASAGASWKFPWPSFSQN